MICYQAMVNTMQSMKCIRLGFLEQNWTVSKYGHKNGLRPKFLFDLKRKEFICLSHFTVLFRRKYKTLNVNK